MGYAFISYNHNQRKDADTLKEILHLNGIQTWMATDDIGGGVYAAKIAKAIVNCACFILILTDDSMKSPHVLNEINLATDNKKPIFPIEFDDIVLDSAFQYYLSSSHIIKTETISLNSSEIRKLITVISACTNGEPEPEPAAPPQETVKQTPAWPLGGFPGGTYQTPWTGSFQASETQQQTQPVFPPSGTGFPYTVSFNTFSQTPYVNTAAPQTQAVPDTSSHGLPGFLKKKKDSAAPASSAPVSAVPADDLFAFKDPTTPAEINTLVETIANKDFNVEPNGYSREQVDDMLDDLCELLDRSDLNNLMLCDCARVADNMKPKRAKSGYSAAQVDAFLLEIRRSIAWIQHKELEYHLENNQ